MIKPSPETIIAVSNIAKHNTHFADWIAEWYNRELKQLPIAPRDTVQIAQGRCQVLTEIHKLIQDAPELAAKLR